MPKLLRTMLYSVSYPLGFLHEGITENEQDEMIDSGEWFDHPAKVPGAPEEMKNRTGGSTVRRQQQGAVRYSDDDLRAMFLSHKEMSGSQVARLATALGIKIDPTWEDEAIRTAIEEAITPPDAPPSAGKVTTAKDVRKLEGAASTGKPAPLKKAPAKKATAKN